MFAWSLDIITETNHDQCFDGGLDIILIHTFQIPPPYRTPALNQCDN